VKVSRRKHALAVLSSGENAGIYKIGRALNPRYSLDVLEKKELLSPTGIRTPDRPGCNLVAILNTTARKIMTVYCQNHKEHINKQCLENSEFIVLNLVAHANTTTFKVVN
jgi:predicted transcriptional regulator